MTETPPVIVVGMLRSGTSLLTRLMGDLGLFHGKDCKIQAESNHFKEINRWVLQECGATWANPEVLAALPEHPKIVEAMATHVRFLLSSPRSARYMGWIRYLRAGSPSGLRGPWGWKDPRNTLVLPVWSQVFPEARVVYIRRHGADVAASLRERHMFNEEAWAGRDASISRFEDLVQWLRPGWYPPRDPVAGPLRSLDLEGALGLWASYLDRAETNLDDHPGATTQLRYEELVSEPYEHLEDLAAFCGLEASSEALTSAADRVDPARARRYRDDEELRAFAREHAEPLSSHGFEVPDGP